MNEVLSITLPLVFLSCLFAVYRKKSALKTRTGVYTIFAAALAGCCFLTGDGRILWALLLFHCYTDCTTGTVFCAPTQLCLAAEAVLFLLQRPAAGTWLSLGASIACVLAASKLLKAYADGDAEIFCLLILAAAGRGKEPFEYMLVLMFGSCILFILQAAFKNLTGFIRHKTLGVPFRFRKEAAMLPAITAGYFLANFAA